MKKREWESREGRKRSFKRGASKKRVKGEWEEGRNELRSIFNN